MTQKDIDRFNRDVDIIYRHECGDSSRSIARHAKISREAVDWVIRRHKYDKRVLEAVALKKASIA